MKKPKTIQIFDTLFWASFILGIGSVILNWEADLVYLRADPDTADHPVTIMMSVSVIGYALELLLWYFVSIRRSDLARKITVFVTMISLIYSVFDPAMYKESAGETLMFLSISMLYIAQLACLFLPGSADWFRRKSIEQS